METLGELVRARWAAGRNTIALLDTEAQREGAVHERVSLFSALRLPWWGRARARRVLDEARAHEETARNARLWLRDHTWSTWDAMARDLSDTITALDQIATGHADDPTEVANRALDVLRGSMARYGFLRDGVIPRPAEPQIQLSLDTKLFDETMTQAQRFVESLRMPEDIISERIARGVSPDEAVRPPLDEGIYHVVTGAELDPAGSAIEISSSIDTGISRHIAEPDDI